MKKDVIIISVIIFIIMILFAFLSFPKFELENTVGYVNEPFIPRINAYNMFKNLSNKVIIKNNVDINKIGKYTVECKYKYFLIDIEKSFDIEIIDKINPTIDLLGSDEVVVCPNKEYIEEGYIANDNYDGNITNKVKVERTKDIIYYSVLDSSNNNIKKERKIIYQDIDKPVISLNGDSTLNIYQGYDYIESGYNAIDNCDGNITSKVVVTGNVDTNTLGTYKLKYEITDSNNNTNYVERTINVRKKLITYGNGKIYLTFDDGSSYLTNQILDILESENVKATFFVVKANDITKRIHDNGHAIGLHSNTHNYSYIYANASNYFNDLEAISNNVYNLIGIKSRIIRFPGGSSNTVSKKYNLGIMTYLTNEVLNRGYIYFDWNIDSNDAGSDIRDSNKIYYNVVNNLSHNKTNVVLMHDSQGHEATVNALKRIISYAKESGYTFEMLNENTPSVVHHVNN